MLSTLASILVLQATFSPAKAQPTLHRRGLPGAVYTCTAPDFRGECQWSAPSNRCLIQGPWPNGIMSIGPDPDGLCILYEKFDCTGKQIQEVGFPGLAGGIPKFGAFKCHANTQTGEAVSAVAVEALDPLGDPRLAGGVGSAERKNHLEELEAMEKTGFREGLIGLKKEMYY